MDMIGIEKSFSNFFLKCNKCGSNDVVINFNTYGSYDDTVEDWEDEIKDIMLKCRKCGLEEIQGYDLVEDSICKK